jgi:uncharacterized repeat protein (TIGR03803 family)
MAIGNYSFGTGASVVLKAAAAGVLFVALASETVAEPTVATLFSFRDDGKGTHPWSSLITDPSGALYGTTLEGGAYGFGTVFQLKPSTSAGWTRKVLHHFKGGQDGAAPLAGLVRRGSGALYGTTDGGGDGTCSGGCGTVYELKPRPDGTWNIRSSTASRTSKRAFAAPPSWPWTMMACSTARPAPAVPMISVRSSA